jgi:transketolase
MRQKENAVASPMAMRREERMHNRQTETLSLQLKQEAIQVRMHILSMIYTAKTGHTGGSLSCADILTALYFHVMKVFPENPRNPARDYFILSKGHSVEAYYAVLALRGFFPESWLQTYCAFGSNLLGHPTNAVPGIEMNTGALGHGLSIAVGIALGLKQRKMPNHVYVVMGDGEQAEGSVWEALMAGSAYHLDNLVAILDRNHLQISGDTEDVMPLEPLRQKYESFGWQVVEIDGNEMEQILDACFCTHEGKPLLILAHTIKGKGVPEMENDPKWHHGVPDVDLYQKAMKRLQNEGEGLQV